ncbi:uncharacterized protein LOC119690277 [Teleopsis dalmanni]|uniref:uncharacterized protein LOC119687191 n=1 Tax=Teleopsis dalmanni TaxID=139649 RepID=UPI0018CD6345|nr:uncharacterized protein LOC119687191 [Teleopsis dalmanni]XP_037961228.1 uncharacterized protein LOC119690277 [Teleopsis dalmanni]
MDFNAFSMFLGRRMHVYPLFDSKEPAVRELQDYCRQLMLPYPFFYIHTDPIKVPFKYFVKCMVGTISSPIYYYHDQDMAVRKSAIYVLRTLKEDNFNNSQISNGSKHSK